MIHSKLLALTPRVGSVLSLMILLTCLVSPHRLNAADDPGLVDRTKAAVEDAGRTIADTAEEVWKQIDQARLKNRTPDQLAAWILMGVLVGSVTALFSALGTTRSGKILLVLLGLVGAFMGGVVVQMGKFDFGMGPVLIRYEELLCAFAGAVVLIGAGRFLRSKTRKKHHS